MEITQELRTLAKFTAGPLPVISVYLNTQWRDQHQRARAVTFFERHLHQARALEPETVAARESLSRDLERLTQWGQQYLHSPGESTMPTVPDTEDWLSSVNRQPWKRSILPVYTSWSCRKIFAVLGGAAATAVCLWQRRICNV